MEEKANKLNSMFCIKYYGVQKKSVKAKILGLLIHMPMLCNRVKIFPKSEHVHYFFFSKSTQYTSYYFCFNFQPLCTKNMLINPKWSSCMSKTRKPPASLLRGFSLVQLKHIT